MRACDLFVQRIRRDYGPGQLNASSCVVETLKRKPPMDDDARWGLLWRWIAEQSRHSPEWQIGIDKPPPARVELLDGILRDVLETHAGIREANAPTEDTSCVHRGAAIGSTGGCCGKEARTVYQCSIDGEGATEGECTLQSCVGCGDREGE